MTDRNVPQKNEKMRLCPSCRCEISVLATKCRHCGEIVGRPKDETRSLSIDDLGGESICHYAPSSNVMDALEAFRLEEAPPAEEPPAKGRGKSKAQAPQKKADLPELDERSRALASLSVPTRRTTVPVVAAPSWKSRAKVAAYFLGSAVVVFISVYIAAPMISAIFAEDKTVYVDYTKTERLLDQKDYVRALLEGVAAQRQAGVSEDAQVMVAARKGVADQVRALLDADPWDAGMLTAASAIVEQVVAADPSPENRRLKEAVETESFVYRMTLESTNLETGSATFRINDPSAPGRPTSGRVGDTIGSRFVLRELHEDFVVVEDPIRKDKSGNGRLVRYGMGMNRTPVQWTSRGRTRQAPGL